MKNSGGGLNLHLIFSLTIKDPVGTDSVNLIVVIEDGTNSELLTIIEKMKDEKGKKREKRNFIRKNLIRRKHHKLSIQQEGP